MKDRVSRIAESARLLIATDFDGTLAPIVERPELSTPLVRMMEVLQRAIGMPQTCVAIVSGRGLEDLRSRLGPLWGAWLVGGHGAEIAGPHLEYVPDDVSTRLDEITQPLQQIADPKEGFWHERKLTSIAVHYRAAPPALAEFAIARIIDSVARPAGLRVIHGKKVLELLAVDADKGRALQKLCHSTGATRVFYLGDDMTDEDAFRIAGPEDIAVKIGQPPTDADWCVATIEEAHTLLEQIVDQREVWLRGVRRTALQHHSVLSDQRTVAVVAPDATVNWMCLPRIDGAAVFASLLDGPRTGMWSVGPLDGSEPVAQRYVGDSFTLETSWASMKVTDYLDGSAGRSFQRAGRTDLVRVIEGRGTARVIFAPRLDFGRAKTRLQVKDGGLLVEGTSDLLALYAPGIEWKIEDYPNGQTATADLALDGSPVILELRAGTRSLAASRLGEGQRREMTHRMWSGWVGSLQLPKLATDLCRRSALMLRSLTHGPTGAILAAATTSLPENAGGVRNWDYRFCWPRDAAVAAASLVRIGNTGVAMRYLDWLLGIVDRCAGPERLRPIYTVAGEELGPEAELSHLAGYRDSKPVRIGNAASHQVQLDVFGPIVDLVYELAEAGAAISPDHWRLVESMATAVERTWHEPDHGIWEIRAERRHHVHSKVMCWVALDRAAKLGEQFLGVRRESWEMLRDRIRDDVLKKGFDPALNSFIAAYDLREADASTLVVGLSGLLDPMDPRFLGTVDLVTKRLLEKGTVYRYRYEDGLAGPEGGFHLCTGWLIEAFVRTGRRDEAKHLFDTFCQSAGATGVMVEQWDPTEQTGLGNFPQAYSHAVLINCAVALSRGE